MTRKVVKQSKIEPKYQILIDAIRIKTQSENIAHKFLNKKSCQNY